MQEKYISILLDRELKVNYAYMHHFKSPVIVASEFGGVDIESVAKDSPQKVKKFEVSGKNVTNVLNEVAAFIGFQNNAKATNCLGQLVKLFKEKDLTLLEVNPIVKTDKGDIVCLDAKLQVDDNASFKHKELFGQKNEGESREAKATAFGMNYIELDGNIGCVVNGAGLAMATMDLIQLYGGKPANFMDVGGGATAQQVTAGMQMIMENEKVLSWLCDHFYTGRCHIC